MLIKRENDKLFSVLFTDTEIDFLRSGMGFADFNIECWLNYCISSRLTLIGYSKNRKEKPNELEG